MIKKETYDGDGAVNATDFSILDANIQGFISSITP